MDAVVLCIASEVEKDYIEEWIEYHLALGFCKIYIIDNSVENIFQKLQNDTIIVFHFPGEAHQIPSYIMFFQTIGCNHKWVAVIDVDEFIVLKKHNNIIDFLKEYCKSGAVAIHWVYFGSNGHTTYSNKPLLERFTMRQKEYTNTVKCIVCANDVSYYHNSHFPVLKNEKEIKDTNNNIVTCAENKNGDDSICQINHYFCKSRQEFIERRINKKRADNGEYYEDCFYSKDFNEIEDLTAWNFYKNHLSLKGKLVSNE